MPLFSRQSRFNTGDMTIREPNGKLYRLISSIAITGIFVAVGMLVLSITGIFAMSSSLWGFIGMIAILCASLLLTLPWIRKIEKNKFKNVAYVFIGLIGLTAILWIICLWIGVDLYNKIAAEADISEKYVLGVLRYLKITLIITLQFVVASTVAQGITKYLKTMVPFQAICYASYLFVDFILTWIISCIIINNAGVDFQMERFQAINNRYVWSFLTLALVYVGVSNGIMTRVDNRRLANIIEDVHTPVDAGAADVQKTAEPVKEEITVESRLAKLKEMYDKDLITKEEYEKKREDILSDM